MTTLGGEQQITIGFADGRKVSGKVITTEITQHIDPIYAFDGSHFNGAVNWGITAEFVESPTWTLGTNLFCPSTVLTVKEWRCEYCQQVNRRDHLECRSCGAPRTFLYEN